MFASQNFDDDTNLRVSREIDTDVMDVISIVVAFLGLALAYFGVTQLNVPIMVGALLASFIAAVLKLTSSRLKDRQRKSHY